MLGIHGVHFSIDSTGFEEGVDEEVTKPDKFIIMEI